MIEPGVPIFLDEETIALSDRKQCAKSVRVIAFLTIANDPCRPYPCRKQAANKKRALVPSG
jgi:hypothetical protein